MVDCWGCVMVEGRGVERGRRPSRVGLVFFYLAGFILSTELYCLYDFFYKNSIYYHVCSCVLLLLTLNIISICVPSSYLKKRVNRRWVGWVVRSRAPRVHVAVSAGSGPRAPTVTFGPLVTTLLWRHDRGVHGNKTATARRRRLIRQTDNHYLNTVSQKTDR